MQNVLYSQQSVIEDAFITFRSEDLIAYLQIFSSAFSLWHTTPASSSGTLCSH